MKVYETVFDENEWFVILTFLFANLLIWMLPKIFSKIEGASFYLVGIYIGMFYDHTISIKPWDFYDVNDNSSYQLIDFLSYVMYGPYSYFFAYFLGKMNIKGFRNIYYILIWSTFSLIMEWLGVKMGVFHYEKGFKMYWSFPIYLLAQTMLIIFFHFVKRSAKSKKF